MWPGNKICFWVKSFISGIVSHKGGGGEVCLDHICYNMIIFPEIKMTKCILLISLVCVALLPLGTCDDNEVNLFTQPAATVYQHVVCHN